MQKLQLFILSTFILCASTIATSANAEINAEVFKTPSNIEIILLTDPTTDFISLNLAFKGAGAIADPKDKAGLGYIMTNLLARSQADGMDRHAKARKIKELGILSDINMYLDDDDLAISFKAPMENFQAGLAMLHSMLFKVNLTNTELNKIKAFGIGNANVANSREETFAWSALRANILQGQPYANPASGTNQGIQALNLEDIKTAFSKRLAKDNLIIAIVGNIDKTNVINLIDQTFKDLAPKAELAAIPKITPHFNGAVKVIFKDSPQSTAIFSQASINYKDPDFYALLILNRILGGEPFTSRLWLEIRERRGLVYNIGTIAHADPGLVDLMLGTFQCSNQDVAQVIQIIKQQWQILKDHGVTAEEFNNAKTGLMGQYALNFVSPEQTCGYLLQNHLLGFDIKHINERNAKVNKISLADVNRVAKQYLTPEQLSFIVIGAPEAPDAPGAPVEPAASPTAEQGSQN